MRIRIPLLGAVVALALAAGCGGPGPATSPATSPAAPGDGAGAGAVVPVEIADFAFNPADATVAAGGTVRWTNNDSAPHSVDWEDDEPESPDLANGDTYERTFTTAGTFAYVCGIHPTMTGSVTVTE